MSEWTPGDVNAMVINPFYAIQIAPSLAEPHEPMVSEDQWVAAKLKVLEEIGAEAYLRSMLSVLKGNLSAS